MTSSAVAGTLSWPPMSYSAAQRLLGRSASKYEVGGSSRHAASQLSESQRSSQDDKGTHSVRSSASARPLLFPSATFASAEHAARAQDGKVKNGTTSRYRAELRGRALRRQWQC